MNKPICFGNCREDRVNSIKTIEYQINNKIIPESYPNYLIKSSISFDMREKFIKKLGYILISLDWIKPLSEWIGKRRCLEVMAGCGSLSYALQQEGIDIIATDNCSWGTGKGKDYYWKHDLWTCIKKIDAVEAVKKYGQNIDIVIMSWAYMDNVAYQVLQTMREINPECIMIFIGEGRYGCTADDEFFNGVQEIKDENFEKTVSNFKSWDCIYDYPQLIK